MKKKDHCSINFCGYYVRYVYYKAWGSWKTRTDQSCCSRKSLLCRRWNPSRSSYVWVSSCSYSMKCNFYFLFSKSKGSNNPITILYVNFINCFKQFLQEKHRGCEAVSAAILQGTSTGRVRYAAGSTLLILWSHLRWIGLRRIYECWWVFPTVSIALWSVCFKKTKTKTLVFVIFYSISFNILSFQTGGCQINHPETEAENRSERTQKIPLAAQVVVTLFTHFILFFVLILLI